MEKKILNRRRNRKSVTSGTIGNVGMSPGTPVFVGEQKSHKVQIDILKYSQDALTEERDATLEDCIRLREDAGVTWINVNGIHDLELVSSVCDCFGLHLLTQEDITNTTQRPKAEEFDTYLFVVLKMMIYDDTSKDVDIKQVSLILGNGFVLSFLEDQVDVFGAIRRRIQSAKGRIRKRKADYLAYALMDSVVDHYFIALEGIGEHVEDVDDEIVAAPAPEHMHEIHRLKRTILTMRKSVWPLREEIGVIEKSEAGLFEETTKPFLRDLYDHTIQVIDIVETYRDILGGMHDTYLSSLSNRMNEVMKLLTIIATIFIPLTFVAGVYGMNFENMPELSWHWGYFAILGVMATISAGMLLFFKKRKWL